MAPGPSADTHQAAGTRERLLDTAERLFAEDGIAAVSLRRVTGEADVNLAAVHYHFGSKNALVEAVYARRIGPLNEERLARLTAAEEAAGASPASLESILEAFLAPALRLRDTGAQGGRPPFIRLMGRLHTETSDEIRRTIISQFEEVFRRFTGALAAAAPHLAPHEIIGRLKFGVGAMAFTMMDSPSLESFQKHGLPAPGQPATADELVRFLAAGFHAPGRAAE